MSSNPPQRLIFRLHFSPYIIVHLVMLSLLIFTVFILSIWQSLSINNKNLNSLIYFLKHGTDHRSNLQTSLDSFCVSPEIPTLPLPTSNTNLRVIGQDLQKQTIFYALKENDLWSIYKYHKPQNQSQIVLTQIENSAVNLSRSYSPIQDLIVFPECKNSLCYIVFYNLTSTNSTKIPAVFASENEPIAEIHNLFFDQQNQIISYTTNPHPGSSRVILNWQGKILHHIDESPGINRILSFKYYLPETDLLVYQDESSGITNFFLANGIGLFRYSCAALN